MSLSPTQPPILDSSVTTSPAHDHAPTTASASQGMDALKDITYGSIAGIAGKYIEYPFDTVKVRLQSQPDNRPLQYKGPLDCFAQSLRKDGIYGGLYRGISAPLVGAAVETSSLFFSYRLAKQAVCTFSGYNDPLPMPILATCGAASGAFTSLLLTPIELVKCKMQVPLSPSSTRKPGIPAIISSIYRHQGVSGFWRGQLGTLIRETGGSAAWFGSYESVKLFFRKSRHVKEGEEKIYQQMLAGAAAGMTYNFAFYPADTIKSRMQTEDVAGKLGNQKQSFWNVGKMLWRQYGIKGLYRGCGITVARSAPSSAFIFTIYETLGKWLG